GPYGPFSMLVNGRSYEAYLQRVENGIEVYLAGRVFLVQLTDERLQRLSKLAGGARRQEGAAEIKAPMPGLVLEVHVKPGDEVDKGMPLIVLEAMKMENDLVAPKAGTVESVNVSKGDKVEQG